jgi:hypothetical protein
METRGMGRTPEVENLGGAGFRNLLVTEADFTGEPDSALPT